MNVAELIAILQTKPQDMQVAYCMYSEHCVLDSEDIRIIEACEPRPDGWIQNKRPDMPTQAYVLFPGN